jgi:indolepyruvate ferredoxin oxidoreductase beta subunit
MDSWVETKQLPVHFVSAAGLVWKDGKVLLNAVDLVPVTVSSGLQQPVTDFETRLAKVFPDALVVDALKIAQEVGNERTMNMVLAGALSKTLPIDEKYWIEAMHELLAGRKAKLIPANEKAFALGRAAV